MAFFLTLNIVWMYSVVSVLEVAKEEFMDGRITHYIGVFNAFTGMCRSLLGLVAIVFLAIFRCSVFWAISVAFFSSQPTRYLLSIQVSGYQIIGGYLGVDGTSRSFLFLVNLVIFGMTQLVVIIRKRIKS